MTYKHSGTVYPVASVCGAPAHIQTNIWRAIIAASKALLFALPMVGLCSQNSFAQSNSQFCQIVLGSAGLMRPSITNMMLSSKLPGATSGVAQITTSNASFRVKIDKPLGFTSMPPNGSNGVTFAASFMGTGATNFSETPGDVRVRMKKGLTRIETHLEANKTGIPFPAGQYSAELVVRCE